MQSTKQPDNPQPFLGLILHLESISPYLCSFLTVVNTFSASFQEKYFLSFVIPLFHLVSATTLIVNGLCVVELGWNYGWNFM